MRLFHRCKHEYQWKRNIHGDEINWLSTAHEIFRSVWKCKECGKTQLRNGLYNEKVNGI